MLCFSLVRPDPRHKIVPALQYTACDDIAVVTTHFNCEGFRSKRANFELFAAPLRKGACVFQAIECAFGIDDFDLPLSPDVWRVRARDVMWQKERLLNAAIKNLPSQITKVAWVDADVLFEDALWLEHTSQLLDDYLVVQPFEWAVRLPRGSSTYEGKGFRYRSFGAVFADNPLTHMTGNYAEHGHTGFAWAARRDLLERHGLFDSCIAGSGDHVAVHGMCGDLNGPCVGKVLGGDSPYRRAYTLWAESLCADVKGRIGYRPGSALHLWHGDMTKRRYEERNSELVAFGFDPRADLALDSQGCCWEWKTHNLELRTWAQQYFASRDEDG